MRSLCIVSVGLVLVLSAGVSLQAQKFESVPQAPATQPAEAGAKIGIINVQRAMAMTQEGRKALEELQAQFNPRQAELQKLQEDVRTLEDQLRTQERTLNDEARVQIMRDLEQKRKQGTRLQQDLQEDVEDAQGTVINQIGEKMQRVIDRYARENNLNLIFNVAPGGPIIFATPTVDITEAIVKLYDQTHPVQTAAAPKPSTPAKPTPPPPKP